MGIIGKSLRRMSSSSTLTVFSLWFFGELAFNILPIAVILTINFAFGESFQQILLLPDWSFASIVLCGGVLTMFIELKTKFQKDSSHKTYTGTRLFTLVLIASVISLTLALLREKGVGIDSKFIGTLQISLFAISASSLLVPIIFMVNFLDTYKTPSESVKAFHLIKYLSYSLDEANNTLRHSAVALSKNKQGITERCQSTITGSDFDSEKKYLENLITQLEKTLTHFKNEWRDVSQRENLTTNEVNEVAEN